MDKNASIWNDEELYRSVRGELEAEEYIYYEGKLRIRSNAFRDISKKPSVDRAKLKEFNPFCSTLSNTDGIVSLIASDIREEIKEVKTKTANRDVTHLVDVIYDPNPKSNPENYAHSQITVDPEFFGTDSKKRKHSISYKKHLLDLRLKEDGH